MCMYDWTSGNLTPSLKGKPQLRDEIACLLLQPVESESGSEESSLSLFQCLLCQSMKKDHLISNRPIWHFLGGSVARALARGCQTCHLDEAPLCCRGCVGWEGKHLRQVQTNSSEGPAEDRFLILQRGLVLVVTATLSPLQKP